MGEVSERLNSRTIGEAGRPVVFLHGLLGQGTNFRTIAGGLRPQFRSVLMDLPNHGRSPRTGSFSYTAMADAVAQEIRAAGLDADGPVHVVGHSMGGKVAMLLALRHPELIDHLVVVDISPADSGAGNFEHLLGSLLALDLPSLTRRSDADDALREAVPEDGVRSFLLQNLRRDEESPDGWRWAADVPMLFDALSDIGGFPQTDAVFDGPTLWLAGARSDYVRDEHADRMRALFPAVRRMALKDAGHWVHADQPDAVIATLRWFLAS